MYFCFLVKIFKRNIQKPYSISILKLFFLLFIQEGKVIKSSSGFKGKGFKFDETEAQLCDERKKLQKAALGLQDSDDEDANVDVRY